MKESKLGVTGANPVKYKTLLESDQTVSKESLFRDDLFRVACEKVPDRNE